jgi:hypothetical protein
MAVSPRTIRVAAGLRAAEFYEATGELWELTGVLAFVERMAGHVVEICERGGLPWPYVGHLYLGLAAHWRGDWETAERELRLADQLEAPGAFGGQSAAHLALHLAQAGPGTGRPLSATLPRRSPPPRRSATASSRSTSGSGGRACCSTGIGRESGRRPPRSRPTWPAGTASSASDGMPPPPCSTATRRAEHDRGARLGQPNACLWWTGAASRYSASSRMFPNATAPVWACSPTKLGAAGPPARPRPACGLSNRVTCTPLSRTV